MQTCPDGTLVPVGQSCPTILPQPDLGPQGLTQVDITNINNYFACLQRIVDGENIQCTKPPRFDEFYPGFEAPVYQPPITQPGPGPGTYLPPQITPIDYGYVDPYGGGVIQPGTGGGFQEVPFLPGEGAIAASAGVLAGPLNECDPDFSQYLPMQYSDAFGSMTVLQVVCPQNVSGGVGPIAPIEQAAAAQLFDQPF